jgi:hypothetical protein
MIAGAVLERPHIPCWFVDKTLHNLAQRDQPCRA